MVFQDVILFDNTVYENIKLGRKNATEEEVMEAARLAHCDEFVRRLPDGYQTMIGEMEHAYPVGNAREFRLPEHCSKIHPSYR